MNGKYRRFVHLPFGQQQRLRRLGFIGDFRQQPGVERIVGTFAQAGDTQLVDIAANTPAQLFVAASVKVTTSSSSTLTWRGKADSPPSPSSSRR